MERAGLIQFVGKDAPIHRAVFVINRDDKVVFTAYMPALGIEPDYEAVLAAAQAAL